MKIPNKQEFQQIAVNHQILTLGDFMNLYKKVPQNHIDFY